MFSALYWGVEEREKQLRDVVASSLHTRPGLRLKVLLDWCRGSREVGGQSSVSLLSPLQSEDTRGRCQLAFYQTPQLRGWLKWLLPSKWNELVGLQHCKVYIMDDTLIMSGANLSRDYFTNRQVAGKVETHTQLTQMFCPGPLRCDRGLQTSGRLLRGAGGQDISVFSPPTE